MLRAASVQLSLQSRRLTSVARTRASLAKLDGSLPNGHGLHHVLSLDWSDPAAFLAGVAEHIEATEQPDLVLAWVHDERLGIRLASRLRGRGVHFFHVIGSASSDPAHVAALAQREANLPSNVAYHQVILGAVSHSGHTRWLTNQEISSGALAAIHAAQARFVVGGVGRRAGAA